jgi:hypothetical protein
MVVAIAPRKPGRVGLQRGSYAPKKNLSGIVGIRFFPSRRANHPGDRDGGDKKCSEKNDDGARRKRFFLRDAGRIENFHAGVSLASWTLASSYCEVSIS